MDKLEGYKTIIVAALALIAAIAQMFGVVISQDTQAGVAGSIVAVLMIAMRIITKGPAFGKSGG